MAPALRSALPLLTNDSRRFALNACTMPHFTVPAQMAVEMLERLGYPREIGVAPRAKTSDREATTDAHAPHIIGDAARESFDADCVVTPLAESVPSR